MRFLSPDMLWLLLAVPALIGAYVALLRRRKAAVRYASLSLIREAMDDSPPIRRHVPALIFLLALIAMIVAVARPVASVTLPSDQRTIILALDVSLSMRATDVQPNRLAAAQLAAKSFIEEQPPDIRIGIVSFAGTAALVQAPTHSRDDLIAAIDRLELERQTAIGSGIIVSLATVLPDAGIDLESALFGSSSRRALKRDRSREVQKTPHTPVAPGSYPNAAIILLTDGRRTMGPDPIDAAKLAAEYGVRVYTVGFGSAEGGAVNLDGWSIYMRFDEETLRTIADITRAEYFYAGTAEDLKKVYRTLNAKFALEKKETEMTALFTAAAALLALVSAALSVLWFHRIV